LVGEWDWRAFVQKATDVSVQDAGPAQQLVLDDDKKTTVSELLDAPAPPSMLALFMQNGLSSGDKGGPQKFNDAASEGSTRSASTASRGNSETKESQSSTSLSHYLVGKWEDGAGAIYQVKAVSDNSWSCARSSSGQNSKKTVLWYDEMSDSVSWGPSWSHYMDASEIRKSPDTVSWFGGNDISKRRPRFTWYKASQKTTNASARGGQACAEAPRLSKENHGKEIFDTSSSSKRRQAQSGRGCRRDGATVSKAQ
jgi:hypothetical protein